MMIKGSLILIDDFKWPIPDILNSTASEGSALEPTVGTIATSHMHLVVHQFLPIPSKSNFFLPA